MKISYTFAGNPIVLSENPWNPFVFEKISYAIWNSELPLGYDTFQKVNRVSRHHQVVENSSIRKLIKSEHKNGLYHYRLPTILGTGNTRLNLNL